MQLVGTPNEIREFLLATLSMMKPDETYIVNISKVPGKDDPNVKPPEDSIRT